MYQKGALFGKQSMVDLEFCISHMKFNHTCNWSILRSATLDMRSATLEWYLTILIKFGYRRGSTKRRQLIGKYSRVDWKYRISLFDCENWEVQHSVHTSLCLSNLDTVGSVPKRASFWKVKYGRSQVLYFSHEIAITLQSINSIEWIH